MWQIGWGLRLGRVNWERFEIITMMLHPPAALPYERPTDYADRVGRWYTDLNSDMHRKQSGQYFTPIKIATFMANLYPPATQRRIRIADPGAGAGMLACALCETLAERTIPPQVIELLAYELDTELAETLNVVLHHTQMWLAERNIMLQFTVSLADFVLAHAAELNAAPRLFASAQTEPFDIIITNPPYLKIAKTDPRAQAVSIIVHGQPNLYALFMAVAAQLLKPGGELLVISPRSYTSGPYFRRFREYFLALMRPEFIHIFESRRDAFSRDEVLQENVILRARKAVGWTDSLSMAQVKVSRSAGRTDLDQATCRETPLNTVLNWASHDKVLRIPQNETDDSIAHLMRSWSGTLHTYGLEISTGPVVPFRAKTLLAQAEESESSCAPLLWMQHIQPMRVVWPTVARGKPQYIVVKPESRSLLVADKHYVLLRRFSAKEQARRLIAAPYLPGTLPSAYLGLENHLNYIHRPGGDLNAVEVYGLALWLNSRILDIHFRTLSGNTQINATEIRTLPLPPWELIVKLGERALASDNPADKIDDLIDEVLSTQNRSMEALISG